MTMTESSATSVTADEVLQRIAVRPPYFDLREIESLAPGVVRASVPAARPALPETGAVAASHAARHLAILGSCAAALARDDGKQHHYLAVGAHYVRGANAPLVASREDLVAEAIATWIDKRSARALVKLSTQQGELLNMLDVNFAVMAPRMFARLHPSVAHELPEQSGAPNELPVEGVEPTAAGVRLDSGPIAANSCAGHFPDYPAAPVAVVMGKLCLAAGHALALHLDQPANFRIEEGWVQASKLAAAGQHLVLEAHYVEPQGDHHVLEGQATADGEPVGQVRVVMSTPDPAC